MKEPERRGSLFTLVAGWALVVLGLALLVLPGPGIPLLLLGLSLLGLRLPWARKVLDRLRGADRRSPPGRPGP